MKNWSFKALQELVQHKPGIEERRVNTVLNGAFDLVAYFVSNVCILIEPILYKSRDVAVDESIFESYGFYCIYAT